MSSSLSHVILTRFNLPTPGVESLVRAREGWLRERQQLFERYCLPSLLAQSKMNYHWIIYYDDESPDWLKERTKSLSSRGEFTPLYRQSVPRGQLLEDISSVVGERSELLLTTNLDNDDAVATDFVARLQCNAQTQAPVALYIDEGLIQRGDRFYRRTDASNAFCSVSEPWDNPMTAWFDWHNRLERHMPARHIQGEPAWLQVVHDGNVSNRVRGRRVDPGKHVGSFGALLDVTHRPKAMALLMDGFVSAPARLVRDVVRWGTKSAIMRLGGKHALDQLKLAAARVGKTKTADPAPPVGRLRHKDFRMKEADDARP